MKEPRTTSWHSLIEDEVLQLLETNFEAGLTGAEVQRRQKRYGLNRFTARRRSSMLLRFLKQFHQPLLYILLGASVITAFLGEWVDSAVIFGVVFVNAIVGFIQEGKAEKAIESLSRMVVTHATVRREGRRTQVSSEELVPGDIVLLQAGDKVPADLRLLRVRSLQVDESMLTGESVPVHKHAETLSSGTILAERANLAFAGTLATYGQAEGVVWATGDMTETGRIAWLISEAADLSTPLTRKIEEFSKLMLYLICGLAVVTFLIGTLRGEKAVEMFMAAVALAVGAIPEGLPAAVTITLAVGVARMAKRRAITRRLPAVETLGSTTVICSDKTGTLTENQMTVQRVFAGGREYEVTGTGYSDEGAVRERGTPVDMGAHPALTECLKAGLLCNDTQLTREDSRVKVEGDPTEAALIVVARKVGLSEMRFGEIHPRLDTIPFESELQFMATLHEAAEAQRRVIYKKGAVERLLERCSTMLTDDGRAVEIDREQIRAATESMAGKGLRVLAFARRFVEKEQSALHKDHLTSDLTFLGLQGMMDPPRQEAIRAVRRCQQAGIVVKMITGDHGLTAGAVARQIGLIGGEDSGDKSAQVMTGRELERLGDEELAEAAEKAHVFARVAPEQKLKLVRALQARGHVVAMTGDGVNDAPALKQADIGVAMGQSGTDVAKGAADIVLTDDNFASIEAAVEEGRGVFDNLTKFIVWTVPTNGGEALILLCAIFFGLTLPALPIHLLWVNLTTAIFLGLALVFEPKEPDLMARPPRPPQTPILTWPLIMRSGLVTLILLIGAFGLFVTTQKWMGASLAEARTVTVNVVVMVEIFYLLNCRSLSRSMLSQGLFSNWWIWLGIVCMIGAQLAFTYLPVMNRVFETAPLKPQLWLYIAAVGLAAFLVIGFEKWVRFHQRARSGQGSSASSPKAL